MTRSRRLESKVEKVEVDLDEVVEELRAPSARVFADLSSFLEGSYVTTRPTEMVRSDGQGLGYRGRINGIHGTDGSGKSLLMTSMAAEAMAVGRHVVWLDCEEATPRLVVERLHHLGVQKKVIQAQFHFSLLSLPIVTIKIGSPPICVGWSVQRPNSVTAVSWSSTRSA